MSRDWRVSEWDMADVCAEVNIARPVTMPNYTTPPCPDKHPRGVMPRGSRPPDPEV